LEKGASHETVAIFEGRNALDIELEADSAALPAVAMAFHTVAAAMFLELAKVRGPGPWVDELKTRLRYEVATLEPPDDVDDEVRESWRQAGLAAVDHIFDYVAFKPKA
jgi:hypothetical protein